MAVNIENVLLGCDKLNEKAGFWDWMMSLTKGTGNDSSGGGGTSSGGNRQSGQQQKSGNVGQISNDTVPVCAKLKPILQTISTELQGLDKIERQNTVNAVNQGKQNNAIAKAQVKGANDTKAQQIQNAANEEEAAQANVNSAATAINSAVENVGKVNQNTAGTNKAGAGAMIQQKAAKKLIRKNKIGGGAVKYRSS